MTKATERQLENRIKELESKVREADTILCSIVLMNLEHKWPARCKRAINDWIEGKSIWENDTIDIKTKSDLLAEFGRHTPIQPLKER